MKYIKKPVVVDAFKLTLTEAFPEWFKNMSRYWRQIGNDSIEIDTLEGKCTVSVGDFIIRGVKGELYSCRDDIFQMTYSIFDEMGTGGTAE